MAVLASSINILSTYYQDELSPLDEEHLDLATARLLAKVPMLAAYAHRARKGQPYMYPDNSLNARENFLRMMFGFPTEPYDVDPLLVKALDQLLILHADHEQNCSTSTVRMVASAQANMFVSVAAGINALSGPLHGGANQAVLEMLDEIHAQGGDATDFMNRVKNKEPGVRLTRCWKSLVGTPCLNWLSTWKKSRWQTTTLSAAGCTPTWTSTPA